MTRKKKFLAYAGIGLLAVLNGVVIFPGLFYLIGFAVFRGEAALLLFFTPLAIIGPLIFGVIEAWAFGYVVWRLFRPVIGSDRSSLLAIFCVLLAADVLGQVVPKFYGRMRAEIKEPVQAGAISLDLSGKTPFNKRNSMKSRYTLQIKGSEVFWNEHTKESPPYSRNVWESFVLSLDPGNGRGTVRKADAAEESRWNTGKSSGTPCGRSAVTDHIKGPFGGNCNLIIASDKYVAFSDLVSFAGTNPPWGDGVYRVTVVRRRDGRTVYKKDLEKQPINPHWVEAFHSGKFSGDEFYYTPTTQRMSKAIVRADLKSGVERTILETEFPLKDWDVDGGVIVYSMCTSSDIEAYDSHLYIKKFD